MGGADEPVVSILVDCSFFWDGMIPEEREGMMRQLKWCCAALAAHKKAPLPHGQLRRQDLGTDVGAYLGQRRSPVSTGQQNRDGSVALSRISLTGQDNQEESVCATHERNPFNVAEYQEISVSATCSTGNLFNAKEWQDALLARHDSGKEFLSPGVLQENIACVGNLAINRDCSSSEKPSNDQACNANTTNDRDSFHAEGCPKGFSANLTFCGFEPKMRRLSSRMGVHTLSWPTDSRGVTECVQGLGKGGVERIRDRRVFYLSPDADVPLLDVREGDVLVIGGLVDRPCR